MGFPWKVNFDWKHWAILLGAAFSGAAGEAIRKHALPTTWADAKSDGLMAAYAGLVAVIALARKSFLEQAGGDK